MSTVTRWSRVKRPKYTRTPRFFAHFKNVGMIGDYRPARGVERNRADRRFAGQMTVGRLVLHGTRYKARATGVALASPTSRRGKAQRAGGGR